MLKTAVEGRRRCDVSWQQDVLRVFTEVATSAVGAKDVDEVLHVIGRCLCELLGTRRCSVYLRGEDGLFHGRVGHAPARDIDQPVRRLVAGFDRDRFTREIVETRASVVVTDAPRDRRTVTSTMRRWGVTDMLGVPLLVGDTVIGVIYVDDMGADHTFTPDEVQMAETFASLAALAIRQTSLYAQLDKRASVIEVQKDVLERLSQVHSRLTRAVLSGADIPAILEIVVDLVQKPVLLYNTEFDVVAWAAPSSADLTEPPKVARSDWVLDAMRNLNADQPSVILPPSPTTGHLHRRLLCELVIDDCPAGFLDVVELGRRTSVIDVKVAERAATVVSLVLLSQRRQVEAEGQAQEDYLNDLLSGERDSDILVRRSPLFGIDLSAAYAVVRVERQGDHANGQSAPARREWWGRALGRALTADCPLSVSLPGADVFVVGPLGGEDGDALQRVKRAVESIAGRSGNAGHGTLAAVSAVCRAVGDYAEAHSALREAVRLVRSFGWDEGVVLQNDLGMLRLFVTDAQRTEALRFAGRLLGPVVDYDGEADGQLLTTLRGFLAAGGHARPAAEALGVHENTVRYRLGRVKKIAGIDVEKLDHLLDARLALQVLDLRSRLREHD